MEIKIERKQVMKKESDTERERFKKTEGQKTIKKERKQKRKKSE